MTLRPKGKSVVVRRYVRLETRDTSVTVEAAFWKALKEIAKLESRTIKEALNEIDRDRDTPNLSSAIRLFVLDHYRRLAETRAGEDAKGKANGAD